MTTFIYRCPDTGQTADAIAMKLGIEKTAIVRVRAGISYALTEAMDVDKDGTF
jgi:hypothetical protein